MRRALIIILALLLTALPGMARADGPITEKAQLNQPGMRVGVSTGSASVLIVERELPNARLVYYEDNATAYEALAQGKIDAYIFDRKQMQLALDNGCRGVHLLDENMNETMKVAVGISPKSHIPDFAARLGAFIAETKQNGVLEDMYHRWVDLGDTRIPEIELPEAPQFHLTVGTAGILPPFSYYVGPELSGFDIEMARRFAAWLNADLEFKVYDFGAIIPAAVTGDVDCIMSNLNITEERMEAIPFSDVIYENPIGIMVRGDAANAADPAKAGASAVDRYNGKVIGSSTGTTFDEIVRRRLPDVTFSYFNTFTDMVTSLRAGKIAAFACDEPVLRAIMAENGDVTMLPEYLDSFEFGFIFGKNSQGEALRGQMSEFIRDIRQSGLLEERCDAWLGGGMNTAEMPDLNALEGQNGKLILAVDALNPPFLFVRGEDYAGLDVDLVARFCERYGYDLTVRNMDFDAVLASVQTGKADIGAASISITEERAQTMLFSEPYYSGGTVLAVMKDETLQGQGAASDSGGAMDRLRTSFSKTFLREDRWRLFARGVVTTLVITLLSILFGTLLGFVVFMLCRNGNAVANAVTRFCLWLVQGMPMVVLLMILYYVVFGSVAISGVAVAVIGFTLTFGASVFGLLRMGVGAVDVGQYEAAYALGYSNRHTFFKIILPQALPHVMPSYKGEIVGLIKATAVVGYIAVQDLTKMGDIVRSRTYEAFFPLIAVTIIYFALEGLLRRAVSRSTVQLDPRRRKPEAILKGVKTGEEE